MNASIHLNDQSLLKTKKIRNKKTFLAFDFKFDWMLSDELIFMKPAIA